MLQPRPVPATPFAERLRSGAGRRALGLGLALAIEALMLVLLLTLGPEKQPGVEEERTTVVTLRAEEVAEEMPEPEQQADEQPAEQRPEPEEPRPPQPVEPPAPPPVPVPMPTPPAPPPPAAPPRPAQPARPTYGPSDNRGPAYRDSERVGTAPNGEPMYAAEWYREPEDAALRAYLSTSRGPGWGLIVCRTVRDFRVEDCVALGEYPEGSQIARSVLAAAWEFRVRPPRRGGRSLVGSWVRIRIDYNIERR